MRRTLLVAGLVSGFFVGCVTLPQEPTADRPKVGCIADAIGSSASRVEGKLLPRIVRVIGTYAHNEEQWMVLLEADDTPDEWVPMAKHLIRFINCGPEATAINQIFDASRSTPPNQEEHQ